MILQPLARTRDRGLRRHRAGVVEWACGRHVRKQQHAPFAGVVSGADTARPGNGSLTPCHSRGFRQRQCAPTTQEAGGVAAETLRQLLRGFIIIIGYAQSRPSSPPCAPRATFGAGGSVDCCPREMARDRVEWFTRAGPFCCFSRRAVLPIKRANQRLPPPSIIDHLSRALALARPLYAARRGGASDVALHDV